jgi:hypothetical protein
VKPVNPLIRVLSERLCNFLSHYAYQLRTYPDTFPILCAREVNLVAQRLRSTCERDLDKRGRR